MAPERSNVLVLLLHYLDLDLRRAGYVESIHAGIQFAGPDWESSRRHADSRWRRQGRETSKRCLRLRMCASDSLQCRSLAAGERAMSPERVRLRIRGPTQDL